MNTITIVLLCIALMLRGVLENFWNVGTVFLDISCIIILFSFFTWNSNFHFNFIIKIFFILSLFSMLIFCLHCFFEKSSIYSACIAYRNLIIYAITLPFALCLTRKQESFFLDLVTNLGLLISFFGIIQFVFRNSLTEKWLTLNEVVVFRLAETDYIRPTGLVGTTIDYSELCIFFSSVAFAQILTCKNNLFFSWIKLIFSSVACTLTLGRVAILGLVMVILLEYLITIRLRVSRKKILATIVVFISVVCVFFYILYTTDILRRFTDKYDNFDNDLGHYNAILQGIEKIVDYPITGYSVDMNISMEIVGDGALWELAVQWGIVVVFLLFLVIFIIMGYARRLVKSDDIFCKTVGISFFAFSIEIFFASLVNSAFLCRVIYVLFFLLGGIVVREFIEQKTIVRVR